MKDYYKILGISIDASEEEIKQAYKKAALRWHPDRNPKTDTTEKMAEINEAYFILKNKEARERYDREYKEYKKYKEETKQEYEIKDDILKEWIKKAKQQTKQTINETTILTKEATKVAINQMAHTALFYIGFAIFMLLAVATCSG